MQSITNFADFPTLSTSEVVTKGDLQSQMTSHGLGSGVYGFIDLSNRLDSPYSGCKHSTAIYMEIPYIIKTKQHLSCFSFFSTILNSTVKKLYDTGISETEIINEFESNGFEITDASISSYDEDENKILLFNSIGNVKLLRSIHNFIADYKVLETGGSDDFIVMPINYLFHNVYHGIYNLANDTANAGSVCYTYVKPRSFIATKKSTILTGKNLSRL